MIHNQLSTSEFKSVVQTRDVAIRGRAIKPLERVEAKRGGAVRSHKEVGRERRHRVCLGLVPPPIET